MYLLINLKTIVNALIIQIMGFLMT